MALHPIWKSGEPVGDDNPHPVKTTPATGTVLATSQVSVDENAVAVLLAANDTRVGAIIKNTSSTATVYVGDATVAAATGHALAPGDTLTLDATWRGAVHGICDTGASATVTTLEVS